MQCELCGKLSDELYSTLIEGVLLRVCTGCSKHGQVTKKIVLPTKKNIKPVSTLHSTYYHKPIQEIEEALVENYATKIKNGREKKGLSHEQLAKALNEKESYLHKIESGHAHPSLALAKKLGRFFSVQLVEEISITGQISLSKKEESSTLTLGDFIKKKN